MSTKLKNLLFSFIFFLIIILITLFLVEFFLFYSQKNLKDIRDDKFLAFNNAKKKIYNLKPYVNSMYALNHTLDFPKIFSPSTFSNSNIFTCNENGYYPLIKTDRYGFYNNDEIWNNNFDIVFLGDSFTAGSCVEIEDNIISNYKKNFPERTVVNLGTPGSFPLLELIKLKEYIYGDINYKKPKIFYWLYYEGNDLRELKNFYNKYKSKYVFNYIKDYNFSQNLITFETQRDETLSESLEFALSLIESYNKNINLHKYQLRNFLTLSKIRTAFKDAFFPETQDIDKNTLKLFEDTLSLSKKIINENDAELIFVYLPTIERYKKFKMYNYKINKVSKLDKILKYNEVIQLVMKLNIKILNVKSEVFDNHDDPLILFPSRKHHHYNEEGYRKVGNFIFKNEKIN
jgi:hypothetical protein